MRKILFTITLLLFVTNATAQDYIKEVCLISESGMNATFTSVGFAQSKKDVKTNAIESLFHTLFFDGVEDVNNSKKIVGSDKPSYTNDFFNENKRCMNYVVDVKEESKPNKIGNNYNGTYTITIRLKSLIKDVQKNTGVYTGPGQSAAASAPKPRIMVVPFKKSDDESYEKILNEDWELSVAVTEVEKGFQQQKIETRNIKAVKKGTINRSHFADNANAANSNDRQLILNSDADVYVDVRLNKQTNNGLSSISIIVNAYETATGENWGSDNFISRQYKSDHLSQICAKTVAEKLPAFLKQIIENYNKPVSGHIEVNVSNDAMVTLRDRCKNGRRLSDFLQDWLTENAQDGVYNTQAIVDETAIFDFVQIPRVDRNNKRMNADRFAGILSDALYEIGVDTRFVTNGNNIMITILSIE